MRTLSQIVMNVTQAKNAMNCVGLKLILSLLIRQL